MPIMLILGSNESLHKQKSHDFVAAQRLVKHSLFIVNPTIVALVDIFYQFHQIRLVEADQVISRTTPYDLKPFRQLIMQKYEKAHEKIMTTYFLSKMSIASFILFFASKYSIF